MKPNESGIALGYHWLNSMGGAERILEHFVEMFPDAPIYTLVRDDRKLTQELRDRRTVTSFLQKVPLAVKHYQKCLPLFPLAISNLKVARNTRLVLSLDASVIKGLSVPPEVPHICYCCSPARYIWDLLDEYATQASWLGSFGRMTFRSTAPMVRRFDYNAAQRVSDFVAISTVAAERIRKFYRRDAAVIFPPVSLDDFDYTQPKSDFYLIATRLVPYKRVELAIEACNSLKRRLIVVGEGSELKHLTEIAGPTIEIRGRVTFPELRQLYATCRAFLYPQFEDFGITALEAQASGRPVIAFRKGGALDTIVEGETGLFFNEQTIPSLTAAIEEFERNESCFLPEKCRLNTVRFSPEAFRASWRDFLTQTHPEIFTKNSWSKEISIQRSD